MIFFPSTVPPVPSFFCLLCLIPLPLISISHLFLNPFLRPLFILSITRFSSLRSHSFLLILSFYISLFIPLRLSVFISSVPSSSHSSVRCYFDVIICFVFVPRYFQRSITIPFFFLSFHPSSPYYFYHSFTYFACICLRFFLPSCNRYSPFVLSN